MQVLVTGGNNLRVCGSCPTAFVPKKHNHLYCSNSCRSAARHKRDSLNENRTQSRRKQHLKSFYGLSLEEYNAMVAKQNNRCAICKTDEYGYSRKNWFVDHDHKTGKVRGLLCGKCNFAVGYVSDDYELALAVMMYLVFTDDSISKEPATVAGYDIDSME